MVYLLSLAAMWGTLLWRVSALEKKVEKHNQVVERTFRLEERVKSIEHEIEDVKEAVKNG